MLGEDGRPGGKDSPVDGIAWVVARFEPGERRLATIRHALRCFLPGTVVGVIAPARRDGRAGVDRAPGRLGQQMCPGPWHHLKHFIAATTHQQPATAGHLVSQPVDRGVGQALRVDGQPQAGQRVEPVRVTAMLADQDLRLKRAQQWGHHGVEGPQPLRITGPGGKRHVHRESRRPWAAGLGRPPGAGPQRRRVLVQADRQHPRIIVEGGLHPVAVVHVDVDVGDPPGPRLEQPVDGDRGIVVHAEPAGAGAHGMVQAASDARAVLRRAGPHGLSRRQGGPGDQRGRLMHAREQRIVRGAQAEHGRELGRPGRWANRRAAPHRCSAAGALWPAPASTRAPGTRPSRPAPTARRTRGPVPWSARPERVPSDDRPRSRNPRPAIPGHMQRTGHRALGCGPVSSAGRRPRR